MKKVLKIIGIVILVLVILLIAAPFLFKGTIEKQVKKAINKNLNAKVEWRDLSLSLFRSFPDAQLTLNHVSVINKAPFEGDTLVSSKSISLDMGIPQLFKSGDEPLSVNEFDLNQAYINIKVNKKGEANYDIAKEKPTPEKENPKEESEGGVSLDVQHYEINDSRINYLDESSKTYLRLTQFNHEGTGDFSAQTSTLHTKTKAVVSFAMDSTNYLEKNHLKLDADIKMDLKNQKYTFEKNKALINQLALKFDGFVKINDNNQEVNISFKTPSSDFKNFLAVIPQKYAKNLDKVKTTGDFTVNGKINGTIDEKHIPKLDIAVKSNNASFKYPDLPKAVKNITIDAVLRDETGLMKDMYLNLNKLTFTIDQDKFSALGSVKNLTGNQLVDLTAKGVLNLANLNKAYPIETDMDLNGILNADLTTHFDMNAIEKEQYQNIKSRGSASISNFSYASDEIPNPIKISKARLSFDPANVQLKKFDLKTGQTDAHLSGKLQNLMGYLFANKLIKGNFKLTSNTFSVNDFMAKETKPKNTKQGKSEPENKPKPTGGEAIKIPSFLDVELDFNAKKVNYDNLSLSNAKGILLLRNETATLKDITADIFGGTIGLDGSVSTKNTTPKFNVDLSLKKINIVQSFHDMDLLKNFAPIAKALTGDLTTSINLNGNLTKDLTPIYSSLAGQGFAKLLDAKVQEDKMPLVSQLNNKLDFLNFDKLNLKDITTNFTFKDGGINIKPFDFKINHDITAKINGRHTFENQMDYKVNIDLPAKYLGSDISGGLAKLTKTDLENTKVAIPIDLSGNFSNPKITVDLKSSIQNLTHRIVEKQKEDLKNKARDKVKKGLNNLLNGGHKNENENGKNTENPTDNKDKEKEKKKEELKNAAKEALNGLFGEKKKKDKDQNGSDKNKDKHGK